MIVTLAEAKIYLGNLTQTDDDSLITDLIEGVGVLCESFTRRLFTLATRIEYVDGGGNALVLRYPPLGLVLVSPAMTEVTQILDRFNSDESYDITTIDADNDAGLVYKEEGGGLWAAGVRRWKVTYGGGYDGTPEDVKQAALIIVADRYENRNAASGSLGDRSVTADPNGIPEAAQTILRRYQLRNF